MMTKKFLDSFIKEFESCKNTEFKWNEKILKRSGSDRWTNILIERSRELRKSFIVNENCIKALKDALQCELTDEEYRLVADAALKIYQDGYDDICVLTMMIEPCIAHFLKKHDLNYAIPLIHAYCFEYEQADIESIEKPKYSYEDIFAFKDEYLNVTSRYARLTVFKSYSNVISRILNKDEPGAFTTMYNLYLEALAIWNDERVQKLDGDDEEFAYFVDRMLLTVTLYENVSSFTEEEKSLYERLISESKKEKGEELDPMVDCIDRVLHNYEGKISNEEIVDYLLDYFDDLFARLDVNGDPNEQEDYIDNCYNVIGTLCYYMAGERYVPSKRDEIIERMNKLRLFVKSLPYTFFTSEMNRYVYMLYQRIRTFLSYEEKKEYLLEVVMFRQPITCIHSLMVESIAEALGKYLLTNRPELFIGVLGSKDRDEVVSKKDEILEYIRESALFHDVGKVSMVDIINTQNRRLSDVEFKKIKTHPANGLTILDKDKDFSKFFDIIIGHHRWYDGSFGYPVEFDNVSSPVRFIIDIVTIADCTDAATDILGRNYTEGKTFENVLNEFIIGAGTRYNPDIVECIKNDEMLIHELTELTTTNRLEIYKKVYSRYII
ncbi:MAG: HD domain-containing protein [Clostridia bacterium]|nr:HD domain-containing protein [Clostridia bacterium]